MRRMLARFLRGTRGAVAVELALIFVPFIGLLFVLIETGVVFLFGFTVDNTTQKIARLIQTGQLQKAGVASASELRQKYLCPPGGGGLLPSLVPCDRILIDVRTSASFANADTSKSFYRNASGMRFCPGDSSSIVVVRFALALPVFLPPLALFANKTFGQNTAGLVDDFPGFPGWNHLIANAFVLQNEPFDNSVSTAKASCD